MILRFGFISLIIIGLLACSGSNTDTQVEELSTVVKHSDDEGLGLVNNNYSIACGLLFKVNDFNSWHNKYENRSENLIISLRSIDDPGMVVVFEGSNKLEDAKSRVDAMIENTFKGESSIQGSPIITYYSIKYFQPGDGSKNIFLALTFTLEDEGSWESLDEAAIDRFISFGLTPVGMGANSDNQKDRYLLLSVGDFAIFKEANNSPREISNFLKDNNLPPNTVLSYWQRH